jgi:protein SCO1/2
MRILPLLIVFGCTRAQPLDRVEPVPVEPLAPLVSAAPSLYELEVPGLDAARGKPVLLTMFYGSCAVACPAVIDHLKKVVADSPRDVRVMLVSFDAARDTPERLAELRGVHHLDARWTLIAPGDNAARELAVSIGFRYRKLASGEFFHGSTIVLLDGEGRPVTKTEGFGQRDQLLTALQ